MKKPDAYAAIQHSQPIPNNLAPEALRARLQDLQSTQLHQAKEALRREIQRKEAQQ